MRPEISGEGDPARGPRPESGYIGLQNHDKNSIVYFKDVVGWAAARFLEVNRQSRGLHGPFAR